MRDASLLSEDGGGKRRWAGSPFSRPTPKHSRTLSSLSWSPGRVPGNRAHWRFIREAKIILFWANRLASEQLPGGGKAVLLLSISRDPIFRNGVRCVQF